MTATQTQQSDPRKRRGTEYDWLIIGAGFTGAVLAERIASQLGQRVLLVDRRDHIGGNAFDELDAAGVLVHRYGPHIFHTNAARIGNYLGKFTDWTPYEHRVLGWFDGDLIPIPFNLNSIEHVYGGLEGVRISKILADEFGFGSKASIQKLRESTSRDVRKVGDLVFEKVFLHYTLKQWGMRPDELDPSVLARVPVVLSYDDRYFHDSFQNMPSKGYTKLFERMLSHSLIEVRLKTTIENIIKSVRFSRMIYTGPIDEFFSQEFGPLPYRSLRFDHVTHESDNPVQAVAQINYPTPATIHPYTRSSEYRLITGQREISATTCAFEYPEAYEPGGNEPFYPIPNDVNHERLRKYEARAKQLKSVYFAGRLADYSYYNMDQAVARALTLFERLARSSGGWAG